MGYACPVCDLPQRDGEHLANHLAFTAMLHGDEHEEWLDEHAPDWGGANPERLAERVVEHAPEADYEEVFEDTVDRGASDHNHDHHREIGGALPEGGVPAPGTGFGSAGATEDVETQRIIAKAQELTRKMREEGEDDADGRAC